MEEHWKNLSLVDIEGEEWKDIFKYLIWVGLNHWQELLIILMEVIILKLKF